MGIYIKKTILERQLCDELHLEKLTFPKEYIEKSWKVFYV